MSAPKRWNNRKNNQMDAVKETEFVWLFFRIGCAAMVLSVRHSCSVSASCVRGIWRQIQFQKDGGVHGAVVIWRGFCKSQFLIQMQ